MNDTQIESLLRQPPRLAAPTGLKAQLLSGIRLSREGAATPTRAGLAIPSSLWQRWFPALSLGLLLFGCFIVVAWQTSQWLSLRRENVLLRTALPDLDELRAEQSSLKTRLAASGQGEIATGGQDELSRLREEVAQLTSRAREITALQTENKRLKADMAAALAKAGLEPEPDPFAKEQAHAKRISCVSNMKQIGLALRMWSNDNKDVFPMDFLTASNELSTPKILTCAADSGRVRANNWGEFNASSVSYEFLSPGLDETDPSVVLTRCPIHNNVGLCDGSVQMLGTNQHVVRLEGKWKIVNKVTPYQ